MTRKTVFIPRYGWRVEFFTDFTCDSTDTVLDALEQIGCDRHHLLDAEYSMMNCAKDTGLTYSSLNTVRRWLSFTKPRASRSL